MITSESLLATLRHATHDAPTGLWLSALAVPPDAHVALQIDPSEACNTLPETALRAAANAFGTTLAGLDACRRKIADDLHAVYNSAWADDDPDEGPPELSRAEFIEALTLSTATYSAEDGSMSLLFDCGDLFAGHSISLLLTPALEPRGRATLIG